MVKGAAYENALRLEVTVIHSNTFGMNKVKSVMAGYKVRDTDNLVLFHKVFFKKVFFFF